MAMNIDENIVLIREIKGRPELWNQFSPNYHNREITDQIWDELSRKYSLSVDHLKAKWIGLRSQFRKSYLRQIKFHKINPGKKMTQSWKYFIPLLFLRNQMKKYKAKSSQPTDQNSDSDEEIVGEMMKEFDTMVENYEEHVSNELHAVQESSVTAPSIVNYNLGNSSSNSVLNNLLEGLQKDMVALEEERVATIDESKTDDDLLFLHSLLPYMKSLNPTRKLILRTKLQYLVCNYIMSLDDKYFDKVAAKTFEKRKLVAENDDNGCDIEIKVYENLEDIPQDEVTPISEVTDVVENTAADINERHNETDQYDISFQDDNINLDSFPLKCIKDDSCIWLLNVDE